MAREASQQLEYEWHQIHDNKVAACYGVASSMALLAIVAVLLRLLCRRRLRLELSYDDYLVIFSLPLALGLCVLLALSTRYGGSKHAVLAGPDGVLQYLKVRYALEIIYDVLVGAIKSSILLFYARLFPRGATLYLWRIFLYIILLAIVSIYLSATIVAIFQCNPTAYTWDKRIPGRCLDMPMLFYLGAANNIVTDLVILLLPMPVVWKLQMPRPKKYAVTGVFLMGGFVCIASIIRTSYLPEINDEDATWFDHNVMLWSVIEPCVGLVSACLPVMGPLLRGFRLPFMGSRSRGYEQSGEARRRVPQVSWLNSKVKLDIVWPGRFKRIDESDGSEFDATRNICLESRTQKDEEIVSPPQAAGVVPQYTTTTQVATQEVQDLSP